MKNPLILILCFFFSGCMVVGHAKRDGYHPKKGLELCDSIMDGQRVMGYVYKCVNEFCEDKKKEPCKYRQTFWMDNSLWLRKIVQ